MASASYASRSLAMSSLNPTLLKWLVACRLANVSPGNVTTGTPIHKASQVVIPPEYGNVSSAMSIDRYPVSISSPVDFPTNSKRSSSMEYLETRFECERQSSCNHTPCIGVSIEISEHFEEFAPKNARLVDLLWQVGSCYQKLRIGSATWALELSRQNPLGEGSKRIHRAYEGPVPNNTHRKRLVFATYQRSSSLCT